MRVTLGAARARDSAVWPRRP